jgi:hypothetical protein
MRFRSTPPMLMGFIASVIIRRSRSSGGRKDLARRLTNAAVYYPAILQVFSSRLSCLRWSAVSISRAPSPPPSHTIAESNPAAGSCPARPAGRGSPSCSDPRRARDDCARAQETIKGFRNAFEAHLLWNGRQGKRGKNFPANLEAEVVPPLQILSRLRKGQTTGANLIPIHFHLSESELLSQESNFKGAWECRPAN